MTDIPAPKNARNYCDFHPGTHEHMHRSKLRGEGANICLACAIEWINECMARGIVGFENSPTGKPAPKLMPYKGQ